MTTKLNSDFELRGVSGCLLLMVMLAMAPATVLLDAFIGMRMYEMLVLPAMPGWPLVPYVVWVGVILIKLLFLMPLSGVLNKCEIKESVRDKISKEPIKTYFSDLLSTVLGRFLLLGTAWILSLIIF